MLFAAIIELAGCGDDPPTPPAVSSPPAREAREQPRTPSFRLARCPADAGNCAAATGRVLFIESVDADGDGDLHVVIAGGSVTAPGITVLDVSKDLRPERDPSIGDRVTGAGPVFEGSYGQRQIEVTVFGVER